jgi:DNA repair protein RadC
LEHTNNQELLSHLAGAAAADTLVKHYGGLTSLAQASFDELQRLKGIGKSKAAAIKAAFLLAQRLSRETYAEAPLLETPELVADLLREQNRVYTVEHLQVLFLNTRQRLIGVENISQGTLDTILVTPREVFRRAIARNAASIIVVHNHPSGDPTPSEADIKVTRELIRAGQLLRIEVLDHVILGHRTDARPCDYVSLRQLGYWSV